MQLKSEILLEVIQEINRRIDVLELGIQELRAFGSYLLGEMRDAENKEAKQGEEMLIGGLHKGGSK